MSTEIEQRVVEMQFDNKQFERNVSTTMSSLDKLKQSLNLTGAAKGLESVGTAAKGINLSGLTGAAETVGLKFNAMWTIADQALRNITNYAYYAGKRIVSALTIDPVKTGFSEYETQINAVQTILANTKSKGTDINDVNKALDELNTYADKTIYNFTEMTRNIGTFTAAGVDLDKSVSSIKGIANLAAVSGSTSQQASTAMYQLSQALAAGKVSLMDWNSVVNAGMGGEVFQTALKRTAEVMNGVDMDAMIEKYGSFRESLTQGEWLTADVLTETLSQLSGAYTEADLLAKGYTKSQAKEILELAETAESAATDVKTFTQLWDTLKESAQSGWTQTWEILVGDFEEAKAMLSKVSKVIGGMIGESAEARNNLLQGWKDEGGRGDLIDAVSNAFEGLMNIVKPVKEAFTEIFPPLTVDQLVSFTEKLKSLTERFKNFTAEHAPQIKSAFKGIFSVIDIGWTFVQKLAGGIAYLIGKIFGLSGGILGAAGSIGEWLSNLRDMIKESDVFGTTIDKIVGFLGGAIDKLKSFGGQVKSAFKAPGLETFHQVLKGIWDVIVKIGSKLGEIFAPLGKAVSDVFNNASLSDIVNDGIFAGILVGIYKFVDNLNGPLGSIKDMFDGIGGEDGIIGGIKETLDSVRGCFEAYQNSLQAETIKKIATAIAILAAAIFVISSIDGSKLDSSLGAITVLFAELIGSLAIFNKINTGGKGLLKGVVAITGLATALLILSGAMKIMSTMNWSEISVGIVGTVAGLGALVGAVNLLPEKNVLKASKAIGKLATALVILAAGMKIMASMSWQEMGIAMAGVVGGLGSLVAAVNLLPKDTALRSLGMVGLATAMVILGGALKLMGTMSWDEIGRGLTAMGGALAEIVLAMNLMPKDAALRGLGMVGLATSMVILGAALKSMGGMSWEEIGRGLVAMGGALAELAIALNLMNGTLAGSAALIIAAGALAIIAPVMKALGGMSWEEIGKGLVALAGAFAVIGIAGALLTPIIPTLLGLATSMAIFGAATIGLGVGLALIGVGIASIATAISVGATAIVAGLAAIIGGIINLIPMIARGLRDAILALCVVIRECTPAIVDTALVMITEVLTSLVTYLPQIGDLLITLLVGLIDVLANNMPRLMESVVTLLVAIINALTPQIPRLAEPIVNLLTAIFQTIADVIGPVVEAVIIPLFGVLVDLIVGLVEAIAPYIPNIENMVKCICEAFVALAREIAPIIQSITGLVRQLGTSISQILWAVAGVINSVAGAINAALQGLAGVFSSIFNGIATVISSIGESIQGVLEGIADTIDSVAGAIDTSLSGLSGVFESAFNGIAAVLDSVGDSIKKVLDGIAGVIESIGDAALNAGTGFEKLAGGIKTITGLDLADMVASLAAAAAGIGDIASHSSGIKDVGGGMSQLSSAINSAAAGFDTISASAAAMSQSLLSTKSVVMTLPTAFTMAANAMVQNMANTIRVGTQNVVSAVNTMILTMVTAVQSTYSTFYSAGGYVVTGFAKGISANTYMAAAKAKAMASAAANAARRELDEHSPSRVGYEIGDFFGIAFVNAIGDNVKKAYNTSEKLAGAAESGLKSAFDKVTRIISGEVDINPTIKPVLDLTNVRSGANAINGMLGLQPSVGVLANVGAVSTMMNRRNQAASNDDVVYAINKLRKALDNVGGTTYQINGITYDDGSNISSAMREIVREARIERRR